jgi:hypothetical protein
MTTQQLHPLARDYLNRLRQAASGLPRAQRDELVEQIEAHLAEAAPPGAAEVDVRTALDRLGEPADIVAEAAPTHADPVVVPQRGAHEWFAIFGLLLGGFVIPVAGWFAGVVLLWTSRAWTTRDKVIGTVLLPGGLGALPVVLLGAGLHTGGAAAPVALIIGLVSLSVVPILTAIYLAIRAKPRTA